MTSQVLTTRRKKCNFFPCIILMYTKFVLEFDQTLESGRETMYIPLLLAMHQINIPTQISPQLLNESHAPLTCRISALLPALSCVQHERLPHYGHVRGREVRALSDAPHPTSSGGRRRRPHANILTVFFRNARGIW